MESIEKTITKVQGISPAERQKFLEAFEVVAEFAFRINDAAGWHNPAPTDAECIANIHGEVSELNEWLRLTKAVDISDVPSDHIPHYSGMEEEGADIIIRLMNWFRRRGWRLADTVLAKLDYNATRPHRHGGKRF